ncbi:cyclophilin-like fold protein [Luteococcus sp. H138]|uniref:cyclophilin-like fold protein n=1 Tax=unclassified Luteococcus TaxID=2639923 RepID=UPI00313CBEB6
MFLRGVALALTTGAVWVAQAGTAHAPTTPARPSEVEPTMEIVFTRADRQIRAELNDSRAASDLFKQLPQDLDFSDFNGAEKIATLREPLSTAGMPDGYEPQVGDLAWFEPNGVIVVFYGEAPPFQGLFPLGRLVDDVDPFAAQKTDFTVRAARG